MPNPTYQYSNGLDQIKVLPAITGQLKWLSGGVSRSGRYFDDGSFHALVTEKSLKDLQASAAITTLEFTAAKERIEKAAITKALSAVFSKQLLIEHTMLFELQAGYTPSILPSEEFVGYEILIAADNDIVQKIETAILHFDTATPVTLYLYREGETAPIWEQAATAQAGKFTVVALVDCYLSFARTKANRFYFGYKPSLLTGGAKPYLDQSNERHSTCAFAAIPATASVPITETTLRYPSETYGLNLEISSMYDFTNAIEKQPHLFDELVGLIMASMIIELAMFTNRKNPTERAVTENVDRFGAQLDLMGALPISDGPQTTGLRKMILGEVKKVQASFYKKKHGVISTSCLY